MALTEEEERKIRDLLAREDEQKKKSILASKNSFKSWLGVVAVRLLQKLAEAAINALIVYLRAQFLGF
ncbi:MAG: hypothetical protein WBV73_02405 [Phormidium sp.]